MPGGGAGASAPTAGRVGGGGEGEAPSAVASTGAAATCPGAPTAVAITCVCAEGWGWAASAFRAAAFGAETGAAPGAGAGAGASFGRPLISAWGRWARCKRGPRRALLRESTRGGARPSESEGRDRKGGIVGCWPLISLCSGIALLVLSPRSLRSVCSRSLRCDSPRATIARGQIATMAEGHRRCDQRTEICRSTATPDAQNNTAQPQVRALRMRSWVPVNLLFKRGHTHVYRQGDIFRQQIHRISIVYNENIV